MIFEGINDEAVQVGLYLSWALQLSSQAASPCWAVLLVYTPKLKLELGPLERVYKWKTERGDFIEGFSLTLFIANRCEIHDFSLFEQNLQVGL